MPKEAMALSEFLLTRIAEDEAAARTAWADSGWETDGKRIYSPRDVVAKVNGGRTAAFIVRNRPARVLAECEAKRRIVEEHEMMPVRRSAAAFVVVDGERSLAYLDGCCSRCTAGGEYGGCSPVTGDPDPCDTLRFLALPYASHPDYRQEWKP